MVSNNKNLGTNRPKLFDIMMIKKIGKTIFPLISIIYLSVLFFLAYKLGLSFDEPFSLSTTANKLSRVISLSYHFEGQPPVYFIILSLWRKLNDGIFFARLLSIIFTCLSAFYLYKVAILIFDKICTSWIIILFLLNPFTIWASLEIRLYSLIILLAIVFFYLFYLIYFCEKNKFKVIFVLIAVLGVYTQYYFVFLIVALSIILLYYKGWIIFLNYIKLSIFVAIIFLPNFLFIEEQFSMHEVPQNGSTAYQRIKHVLTGLGSFYIPIKGNQYVLFGRVLRFVFIILLPISYIKLYISSKSCRIQDFRNTNVIIILAIFITFIFLILFYKTSLSFDMRYLSIAYPFCILIFLVFGVYERKYRNIIYSAFAIYFVVFTFSEYRTPFIKSGDYRSVANCVQNIQLPKEPILFLHKPLVLGFDMYYEGGNSVITLPELKFNHNFYKNNLKDTCEANQLIEDIDSDGESLLVISGADTNILGKLELTNEMFDTYLKNNYKIQFDTTFEGKSKLAGIRLRRITKIR